MERGIETTFGMFDKLALKYCGYMYTASIAKEATASSGSNGGILIVGMIIVIVGLVGFIITKNNK